MSKIPNGTYKAVITKAFVAGIGNNNTQAFVIEFALPDIHQSISWNGWMTEKAYERTLEQLAKLGFDETKPQVNVAGFPSYTADHFEIKSVELVIEAEPDLKDPTKFWPRVKWINLPTQEKFKSPPIKGSLPTDFKSQMAATRAKLGIKKSPTTNNEGFPF